MGSFSSKLFFFMTKTRRERCPLCGFLDVIKWGVGQIIKGINARTVVVYLSFVVKM